MNHLIATSLPMSTETVIVLVAGIALMAGLVMVLLRRNARRQAELASAILDHADGDAHLRDVADDRLTQALAADPLPVADLADEVGDHEGAERIRRLAELDPSTRAAYVADAAEGSDPIDGHLGGENAGGSVSADRTQPGA